MNKKLFTILLVTAALALLLSACKMPLSTGPKTTPTTAGELPFPVATQSDLVNQILHQTQTAIAGGGVPAENTTPGAAQETPQPGDNQAGGGQITPSAEDTQAAGGGAPTGNDTGGGVPSGGTDQGGGVPTGNDTGGGAPSTSGNDAGGGAPSSPAVQPTPRPTFPIPPTPTTPATYAMQRGEFPYCIARRYNLDAGALLAANGLGPNSPVSVGTTLTLPQGPAWSAGSRARQAHPATYTVRSGDTLNSIACLYGDVFPESIAAANGLQPGAVLDPGMTLNIP